MVAAALEVGRERMRRVRDAASVEVRQAGLLAVRAGQPAEEVVERPVLHHHDHDVVDPGAAWIRQRAPCSVRMSRRPGQRRADDGRRTGQKTPSRDSYGSHGPTLRRFQAFFRFLRTVNRSEDAAERGQTVPYQHRPQRDEPSSLRRLAVRKSDRARRPAGRLPKRVFVYFRGRNSLSRPNQPLSATFAQLLGLRLPARSWPRTQCVIVPLIFDGAFQVMKPVSVLGVDK